MVVPFFFSSKTSSTNSFCINGSSPLVGSSKITNSGWCINAFTIPIFCFIPLDILFILPWGFSPNRSIRLSICLWLSIPFMSAMNFRNPRPVMSSGNANSPARYPVCFWISCACKKQSIPIMRQMPRPGRIKPINCRIVVVFPAPFGPRYPNTSPLGTANERPNTPFPLP